LAAFGFGNQVRRQRILLGCSDVVVEVVETSMLFLLMHFDGVDHEQHPRAPSPREGVPKRAAIFKATFGRGLSGPSGGNCSVPAMNASTHLDNGQNPAPLTAGG
jgi:hypothetical protein